MATADTYPRRFLATPLYEIIAPAKATALAMAMGKL
jgi:hypothetical protein